MADLKKLIGNALNKANGSSSDDGGKKKKKETFKQGHEKRMAEIQSMRGNLEKMTSNLRDKKPNYNYSAPASAKTPKPAPVQNAIDKRNKEQAKWNDKYSKGDVQGSSNNPRYGGGGPGGKWVESPARRESNAAEIKRVTKPGGMKTDLTMFDRSLGKRRKDKFSND